MDFLTEDQDGMCQIVRVQWTIVPLTPPRPWIACSGCGGPRPFQSSGKVRLNANGRRLDAWLIYRCSACEKTWNRPIFERRNVRDIDAATLAALQSNDPDWIEGLAFDVEGLRQRAQRIDEFGDVDVRWRVLGDVGPVDAMEIDMVVQQRACLRLDRLLAAELGISRPRLWVLQTEARLRVHPERADGLRRRIRDGMRAVIVPEGDAERHALLDACARRLAPD